MNDWTNNYFIILFFIIGNYRGHATFVENLEREFQKKFSKDGSCSFFSTCAVDEGTSPDALLGILSVYYENSMIQSRIEISSRKNRVGNRQLLVILPPPFDCLTDFPFDPTCILDFFPITPPTWLQPFIDFTCSCPDYVDTALPYTADGFNNFLLVLKTGISALSSIPFISSFLSTITLPSWIQDNFFLDTPGTLPSNDDLICALIHMDYFLAYAIPGLLIAKALLDSLAFIPHCFKTLIELQLLRYIADLIERDIFSDYLGNTYDRIFEREGKKSLQNPQFYCSGRIYGELHHDPMSTTSIDGKQTKYSKGVYAVPLQYDPLNNLRKRTDCNDSFNAPENKEPLNIHPPYLIQSEFVDKASVTSYVQRRQQNLRELHHICKSSGIHDPKDINRIDYMCFPENYESPLLSHHGLIDEDHFFESFDYHKRLRNLKVESIANRIQREFGDIIDYPLPDKTNKFFFWLFRFHPTISVHHSGRNFEDNLCKINNIPPGKRIPIDVM